MYSKYLSLALGFIEETPNKEYDMKQGKATTSMIGSTKTEPVSRAVSPGAVSRLGVAMSPQTKPEQMYQGRGLKAPMVGSTSHKAGSQGKH